MPIGQLYKKFFAPTLLLTISIMFWVSSSGQTTLVDPAGDGGFTTGTTFAANNWTVANGPFNNWYVGTAATGYTAPRGAFIGTNSSTYSYTNFGGMVNHFYRSVTIPTTQPNVTLSFNVKVVG